LMGGGMFSPTFLSKIAPFRALRFMDWMRTNSSPKYTWATRSHQTDAFWSGPNGVPMEVMVALCNKLNTDCWFNMPTYADQTTGDTFVTNLATYVHANLGSGQRAYMEYSNEVWNGATGLPKIMETLGRAMWPSQSVNFNLGQNYYGMRTAQFCDEWKSTWGADSSRVTCVMGSQTANVGVAQIALACTYWANAPCASNHGITALAVTGYFGPLGDIPTAWLSLPDGGMANLCAAFTTGGIDTNPSLSGRSYIANALLWLANNYTLASAYGLEMVAYEGGPGLQPTASAPAGEGALYTNFSVSPCMQDVYTQFLKGWKATGYLNLMNHFNDVMTPQVQYGLWGALYTIWDTGSAKYNALTNFIATNPCWWNGCGTTSAAPPTSTTR